MDYKNKPVETIYQVAAFPKTTMHMETGYKSPAETLKMTEALPKGEEKHQNIYTEFQTNWTD